MGHGVGVEYDILDRRITQLIEIVDELHEMLQGSWHLPNRQSETRWTDNPGAQQFVATYKVRLGEAEELLRTLWRRVEDMYDDLRASAESLDLIDTGIGDQLESLKGQLDNAPEPRSPGTYGPGTHEFPMQAAAQY